MRLSRLYSSRCQTSQQYTRLNNTISTYTLMCVGSWMIRIQLWISLQIRKVNHGTHGLLMAMPMSMKNGCRISSMGHITQTTGPTFSRLHHTFTTCAIQSIIDVSASSVVYHSISIAGHCIARNNPFRGLFELPKSLYCYVSLYSISST